MTETTVYAVLCTDKNDWGDIESWIDSVWQSQGSAENQMAMLQDWHRKNRQRSILASVENVTYFSGPIFTTA